MINGIRTRWDDSLCNQGVIGVNNQELLLDGLVEIGAGRGICGGFYCFDLTTSTSCFCRFWYSRKADNPCQVDKSLNDLLRVVVGHGCRVSVRPTLE